MIVNLLMGVCLFGMGFCIGALSILETSVKTAQKGWRDALDGWLISTTNEVTLIKKLYKFKNDRVISPIQINHE